MNSGPTIQASFSRLAVRIGWLTTAAIGLSWVAIVMGSGSMIPRGTLIGALLATVVAICAYRFIRRSEVVVLGILVPFGAVIPAQIGGAPELLRYVGFLSFGYVVAALLLIAATRLPRRVG